MPKFIINALDNAEYCQGAVAVIFAEFIIGGCNLKELLSDVKVYTVTVSVAYKAEIQKQALHFRVDSMVNPLL